MRYCKTEASYKPQAASTRRTQYGLAIIPVLLSLLTLLASIAAMWQWQRSQFHTQKAATATTQLLQPSNLNNDAAVSASYVTVTGTWLVDSTTFVSPRMMDGRMGAQVVSVFAYVDSMGKTQYIAVQRGWAEQAAASVAPAISALPTSPIQLIGELVTNLPRAFELKSLPPRRLGLWQNYDAIAHGQLVKVTLQPQVLILLPNSPDTEAQLLRRIPAQQAIDNLKQKANSNQGYTIQWLGLALVGLIGLAWMWRTRLKT